MQAYCVYKDFFKSEVLCCIVDGYYCCVVDKHCVFSAGLWYALYRVSQEERT